MITDIVLALSLVTLVVLGTRVLSFAGGSRAATFFGLYCYAAAFITIPEIMTHYATDPETARAWGQVAAVWPLAWVFYATFSVESAGVPRYRRTILATVVIAAVAVAVSYFILAGRGDVIAPASDFGYVLESPFIRTPLGVVVATGYAVISVITVAVLFCSALRSGSRARRLQMRFILLAYVLGFLVGIVVVLLREVGGFPIREVNGLSYLAIAATIYLGIVRKHLVHLSPELVARQALDQIEECFVLTDEQYRIVSVNAAASKLLGVPRKRMIGSDFRLLLGLRPEAPVGGDVHLELGGGKLVMHLSESLTRNHLDQVVGRVIVGHDMTAVYRREEQLENLVSEKNLLVRELHHRVRNTVQVISALVTLKSAGRLSEESAAVIREISERIDIIAMVYSNVYDQESPTRISLDRALGRLSERVASSSDGRKPCVELDLQPLLISAERAIPVLLCVAELLSNALRHAYPQGRSGTIRIISRRASPTHWSVTTADDGVGLQYEKPAGSAGLSLAEGLAGQIGGSLRREAGPGTRWVLSIPLDG